MNNVLEVTQINDKPLLNTPNLDVPFNKDKLIRLFEILIEMPDNLSIVILRKKQLKLINEIIEESNTIQEVFDAINQHNSTLFSDVKIILEMLTNDSIRLKSFIQLSS